MITPRWQYVLAAATPAHPSAIQALVDETFSPLDPDSISCRQRRGRQLEFTPRMHCGYEIGKLARERGAFVIPGGIHATLPGRGDRTVGGLTLVVKAATTAMTYGNEFCRLRKRHTSPVVCRRPPRRVSSLPAMMGLDSAQPLHVGIGSDRARMSKALFVLLLRGRLIIASPSAYSWMS